MAISSNLRNGSKKFAANTIPTEPSELNNISGANGHIQKDMHLRKGSLKFAETTNAIESSEVKDSSGTNDHTQQDEQNDFKKYGVSTKVFKYRNSVLTDLMQVNHIRSLYNINWAFVAFLLVNIIIFYSADPSAMWDDLQFVSWTFSGFTHCAMIWMTCNLMAFAFYEGFKLWIAVRNRIHPKVADWVFLILYIVAFFSTLFAIGIRILKVKAGVTSAFATAIEEVRIYMKIHSFVRENTSRVLYYENLKDGNQQRVLYPTRKHFLYFLFAPTFIYRDSYPRTEKRRWGFIFLCLFEIAAECFLSYCLYTRLPMDLLRTTGLRPFTKQELVFIVAESFFTGPIYMFMMNYSIIHTWLNFAAELLRFGDREFYQDWWNCDNFITFYRKWNYVVNQWLHAYIYIDLKKLGLGSFSIILTFVVSALFHEYIFCLSFKSFYPVLCVSQIIDGFSTIYINFNRRNTIGMWVLLACGWGYLITLYTMEWYARINCPKEDTISNFFMPRTWDPSCKIFDFS